MRIITAYPHAPYGGGSSYYFRALAEVLAKHHDVLLLLPHSSKLQTTLEKREWDIPFEVMGSSNVYWPHAKRYTDLTINELNDYRQALTTGFREAVLQYKPDVIHTHFMLPSGWVASEIGNELNVPVVITSHGVDISLGSALPLFREYADQTLRYDPTIITVSPDHSDWFKEVFNLEANEYPVCCLGGGIDHEYFRPDVSTSEVETRLGLSRKSFVLGVGRFEYRKGFHILLEAATQIDGPVVIVGDGWERHTLETTAKMKSLKNVRFLGFLGPQQRGLLRQIYTAASTIVIPSLDRRETLGFVALEALASGTPVIASAVGGLPYILDDCGCGFLVPPNDSLAISEFANYILKDSSLSQKMGLLGRERILHQFRWDVVADKYIQVFQQKVLARN